MIKVLYTNCLLTAFVLTPGSLWGQSLERDLALNSIPIATTNPDGLSLGVGSALRAADHATIAMNSDKDILVAYHTIRDSSLVGDALPDPSNGNYAGEMKQVEVAFFDYDENSSVERWIFVESRVIGAIDHSPIALLNQQYVRCERPDVIAVEDKFFVVWTRRYSGDAIFGVSQENEPAVLECAWIEKEVSPATTINVYGFGGITPTPGRGFSLDEHLPQGAHNFYVRECSGVGDSVALTQSDSGVVEVAVVYPHFVSRIENPVLPHQPSRRFDLRVVTCSFDKTTKDIEKESNYPPLRSDIRFDGKPMPNNSHSPGLILPDLATSSEERAFWMVHEQQRLKSQGVGLPQAPDGKIKLDYYKFEPNATDPPGSWEQQASKTFQGANGDWSWKRRPMISSFTTDTDEHVVSLAFSTVSSVDGAPDDSSNLVYEHWEYDQGSIFSPPTYSGISLPIWDDIDTDPLNWLESPLPVQGRTTTSIVRRCYLTGAPHGLLTPTHLVYWNPFTSPGSQTLVDTDANSGFTDIRRPAVSYRYFPSALSPDYFAVT